MYDLIAVDKSISTDELFHVDTCLSFGEPVLYLFAEINFAKLGYDVSIVLGCVDFVQSQDIGKLLHFLENLDL
jgi:hypothetical protein